jgi:hypothetical protein
MNVMRCTQPFIPISGRLGKQILELRSFGITNSDFCKHLASKYSGSKLRRLNFPVLTLLKRLSSHGNIINIIQVLKNQIISAPPFTTNLSLNLNLLFWHKVVRELVIGESKFQPQSIVQQSILISKTSLGQFTQPVNIELRQQERSLYQPVVPLPSKTAPEAKPLLFQPQSIAQQSILISKTSLRQFTQPVNIELRQQERLLYQPVVSLPSKTAVAKPLLFQPQSIAQQSILISKTSLRQFTQPVNIELRQQERSLYQPVVPFQSQTAAVAKPLLFQPQSIAQQSILISKTSLRQFTQPINIELRQQERSLYQPVVPFQSQTAAVAKPLLFQQQRAVEISTPSTPQPANVIPQTQNQQLDQPGSKLTLKSQADHPTLVNRTQKFVLINSANISRITSTVEQTSLLMQRLQSVETQTLIQHKKGVTHSLDDLSLAPHHIRTKELNKPELRKLSPSFETEDFVYQQQVKNLAANKQPNYRTSPDSSTTAMEFVQPKANPPAIPTNQESIVGMKKDLTKQRQSDVNMPTIDVNLLADQVYQVIERKIKVERQRRGIF